MLFSGNVWYMETVIVLALVDKKAEAAYAHSKQPELTTE